MGEKISEKVKGNLKIVKRHMMEMSTMLKGTWKLWNGTWRSKKFEGTWKSWNGTWRSKKLNGTWILWNSTWRKCQKIWREHWNPKMACEGRFKKVEGILEIVKWLINGFSQEKKLLMSWIPLVWYTLWKMKKTKNNSKIIIWDICSCY